MSELVGITPASKAPTTPLTSSYAGGTAAHMMVRRVQPHGATTTVGAVLGAGGQPEHSNMTTQALAIPSMPLEKIPNFSSCHVGDLCSHSCVFLDKILIHRSPSGPSTPMDQPHAKADRQGHQVESQGLL